MGDWNDFYWPGRFRIIGGCVYPETGVSVPRACGAIELIWCGLPDVDEEEATTSRIAGEAVQETSYSASSAFSPATDKDLIAHCPRDQSSQRQVLQT